MFSKIARFEFAYQAFSPAFIVIYLIFFLLTFASVTIENVTIGGGGNTNLNSPYSLSLTTLIMSIFAIFLPTALLSNTVLRDQSTRMDGIIFSTPVTKSQYLFGRFTGAFAAVMLAFTSIPLGVLVGSFMPWLDQELVGPFRPLDYVYSIFVIGFPNMLVSGLVMFAVANLTRSTMLTYMAVVAYLVGFAVSQTLLDNPEMRSLAALIDPFGAAAWAEATRNWTAFERNAELVPLEGLFLQNRLLFLGIGIALLFANYFLFSFRKAGASVKRRGKGEKSIPSQRFLPTEVSLPAVSRTFNAGTARQQFFARTAFEMRSIFKSVTFWILLALGVFNTAGAFFSPREIFGTPTLPVTSVVIELIFGAFAIIPIIVIAFYAGDLIWRDRGVKMHEIVDATPTPSWAFLFPKFLSIVVVVFALLIFSALTGVGFQLIKGFTDIEPGQYATRLLFMTGWPLVLTVAFALFVQVVFNNRYLGYLVLLIWLVASISLNNAGFEDNLYLFSESPAAPYSDMNGYGHFLPIFAWFQLYWTFISAILLILAFLLWNRGALTSILRRVRDLPSAITGISGPILALSVMGANRDGHLYLLQYAYRERLRDSQVAGADRRCLRRDLSSV